MPARCQRPPPLTPKRRLVPVSLARVAAHAVPEVKVAVGAAPVKAAAAPSSLARHRSLTKPLPPRTRRLLRRQGMCRPIAPPACRLPMANLLPTILRSRQTKTIGPKAPMTQATKAMTPQAMNDAARAVVGVGAVAVVRLVTASCRLMPAAKTDRNSLRRWTAPPARRFKRCPTRYRNPSPSVPTCFGSERRAKPNRSRLPRLWMRPRLRRESKPSPHRKRSRLKPQPLPQPCLRSQPRLRS